LIYLTRIDLCNESSLTPEQKQEELLPIAVQEACVLITLGREVPDIPVDEISDLSTKQIAQNMKLTKNPYLTQRLYQTPQDLFEFQKSILEKNKIAIDHECSKFKTEPKTPNESVAFAAGHARNEVGKAGLKKILPLLEKRPKDIGLILTIVQLYMLMDNKGGAIKALDGLELDQPGLLAIKNTLLGKKIVEKVDTDEPVEDLVRGVDINVDIPKANPVQRRVKVAKQKKRIRKSRLREGKPDPERWLPLRDRSTWKPKKKKGKKK
jgi:hypothetical protein